MKLDLTKKTYLRAKECAQNINQKSQLGSFLHISRYSDLPKDKNHQNDLIDRVLIFPDPDKIKKQINNNFASVSKKIDTPYISPNQRHKQNPPCDNGRQGAGPLADFFKGCRHLAVYDDKTTQEMALECKDLWPPNVSNIQALGRALREM